MTTNDMDMFEQAVRSTQGLMADLAGIKPVTEEPPAKRMSPVTMYVRNLAKQAGQTYYTASEVAEQVGVSVQAVRKYGKNEVCGRDNDGNKIAPSLQVTQGKMTVYLYTPADVAALKQYLGDRNVVTSLK